MEIMNFCFLHRVSSSLSSSKSPGGKHVTITVRETKTERMTPVNQTYSGENPYKILL